MPRNQFQRSVFAFLTVFITVHAYVFYSLYVINGSTLMSIYQTSSVLEAIDKQGGVYMFGTMVPIYVVILSEFILAFLLESFIGSPFSFKMACKVFNPKSNHPMMFETAIICATVGIMCPLMSLIAAGLYYPYYQGFNVLTFIANWLKLVCFNFPFAYFSQLFFIQPFVRSAFKFIFRKDIEKRKQDHSSYKDEVNVIEDVIIEETHH